MTKTKMYVYRNFEQIMVLLILVAVFIINYFISEKMALLNLFYVPALVSGFILGKRKAMLMSIFSVAVVMFYVAINYDDFVPHQASISFAANLLTWGSFLILVSIIVGHLHEENQKRYEELKHAYIGILEILSKYLESTDQYTQGHSIRVSKFAKDIATSMNLPDEEIENIKVAALLHDIGKAEISTDVIQKAAKLSESEKTVMAKHTVKGVQLITKVGEVLSGAIPLVLAHHEYFYNANQTDVSLYNKIPRGACIIAVADAYDAMITDRPYRAGMPPWKAFEELEKGAGTQFDPEVVKCFKTCLTHHFGTHQILSGKEEDVMA